MSDKTIAERMGIAETKIEDLELRASRTEELNEERKNQIIKGMWETLKLTIKVTVFAIVWEMAKSGCKWCGKLYGAIFGDGA